MAKKVHHLAVKIAVNGYGNFGKRVADAVTKQDDMKLVSVSKTRPNFEAFVAAQQGYPLMSPRKRTSMFLGRQA